MVGLAAPHVCMEDVGSGKSEMKSLIRISFTLCQVGGRGWGFSMMETR